VGAAAIGAAVVGSAPVVDLAAVVDLAPVVDLAAVLGPAASGDPTAMAAEVPTCPTDESGDGVAVVVATAAACRPIVTDPVAI
jgi:hypothetical protein